MSEQTDTNPEEAVDTVEQVSEQPDTSANTEAAKYRRKLREAEAERDQATMQRDALARSIAEGYLPANVPARLFWEKNTNVTEILGKDGGVDKAKVEAAAKQLVDEYGLKPAAGRLIVEADGKHANVRSDDTTSWASVVRGPNRDI
ncbi:MAG: hypothetical protein LKJ18_03970 [Ancrocorticia sp.]|jgi:hypothetical protein|nr:hypothetical protein [Ancrocorticia sp.]MCI2003096.1 hypothetical protein [Ancrocorticia sp.]